MSIQKYISISLDSYDIKIIKDSIKEDINILKLKYRGFGHTDKSQVEFFKFLENLYYSKIGYISNLTINELKYTIDTLSQGLIAYREDYLNLDKDTHDISGLIKDLEKEYSSIITKLEKAYETSRIN